jgi:hypothetical protein
MVKLFTHKCFQRYPDFHIRELVNPKDKSTLTNNSTTIMNRGRQGYGRGSGKGQSTPHVPGQQNNGQKGQRVSKGKGKGKSKPTGLKGNEKGKGKSQSRQTGNRNSTPCGFARNPAMKPGNAANFYTTRNKNPPPP